MLYLKILYLNEFTPDKKENQWRLVVDYPNPRAIILCENKSFMKQPWIAKNTHVKMCYVGCNNIKVLDDIDEKELVKPIYYSCDWDLTGLQICTRIKVKLRERKSDIILLYPNKPHKKIKTHIDYLKSHWELSKDTSELSKNLFTTKELTLINDLIKNQMWIEEESFNSEKIINETKL